jgi:hypothetical protein
MRRDYLCPKSVGVRFQGFVVVFVYGTGKYFRCLFNFDWYVGSYKVLYMYVNPQLHREKPYFVKMININSSVSSPAWVNSHIDEVFINKLRLMTHGWHDRHVRQNDEYIRQHDKLMVLIWGMKLINLYLSFWGSQVFQFIIKQIK